MIDPNQITTVRVGELPPSNFNLTDNIPHEIGTDLNRGTIQQLADFIGEYLGTTDSLAFNPTTVEDGGTLPETDSNEWMLVGKGTFNNVGGQPSITTTEELNALTSNGEYWNLSVQIPINVELAGITQNIRSGYTDTTPSEDAVFNRFSEIISLIPGTHTTDDLLNNSPVPGETDTDALTYLLNKSKLTWGYATATNGGSRIISPDEDALLVDGGLVANYTVTLPALTEAKKVLITFNASVTDLNINAGGVIDDVPTSAKSYGTWVFIYDPLNNQWSVVSAYLGNLGAQIAALTNKGTIVNNDRFAISDSENSNAPKSVSANNLHANYLKPKNDLLYEKLLNKATDFTIVNDTLYPSVEAVKEYADSLLVGVINLRGLWDASTNLFPTTGGSGTSGAVRKGDLWYVSVPGVLAGKNVNVGDSFFSLVNTPGQTASNWNVLESNIGYVPANDANVIHTTGNETKSGILNMTDMIQMGNVKTTFGLGVSVSKNIPVINRHIFEDYSVINTVTPGSGFGCYDCSTEMTGSISNDHFNAYQSRLNYSASANLSAGESATYGMSGMLILNQISGTGRMPVANGIRFEDLGGVAGKTDKLYGIWMAAQTKGVENWDIYALGNNNYLGALKLGAPTGYNGTDKLVNGGTSLFEADIKSNGNVFLRNQKGFYSFGQGKEFDTNNNFFAFYNDGTISRFISAGHGTYAGSLTPDILFSKLDEATLVDLMRIKQTGVVQVHNLAGTGTRTVVADASGNLSATSTPPDSRPYKVYSATFTQAGTGSPVATISENTLSGAIVWTRQSTGVYVGTLSGAFPTKSKVHFYHNVQSYPGVCNGLYVSTGSISLQTTANGVLTDGILNDANLEIRVYP